MLILCSSLASVKTLQADTPSTDIAYDITVTLLGTGTPPVSSTQYGAATLVEAGSHALLFDCGRGCGIRLMQSHPQLYSKINHLFLTHMHSDHLVGTPDLYMNGWLLGRQTPFFVYGPKGTQHFMKGLKAAFQPDIYTRNELEGFPPNLEGLSLKISENAPTGGIVFDQDGVKVTAFSVDHAQAKPAYGYRVEYNGRSVMLSGDTKLTPNLFKYGQDADLIIHEVMPPALIKRLEAIYKPEQVQKIVDHHMLAADVGELLATTNPRLSVYSHYLSTPSSNIELLNETKQHWKGHVIAGADLMRIAIGAKIQVCNNGEDCTTVNE